MKFIVTCETTDSYSPVSDISIPLWAEYCNRHDYKLSVRNVVESERGPVWERVRHIQDNLKYCDWVVHVDLDAIPTNFCIPLTEFANEAKAIVISKAVTEDGSQMFNDGIFLVNSKHPETEEILDWAWRQNWPEKKIFCAQDALWNIYKMGCDDFHVIPQFFINAFDYRLYSMPESTQGQWQKGSFAIHFPGCSTEKRVELLNRYKEEIIR